MQRVTRTTRPAALECHSKVKLVCPTHAARAVLPPLTLTNTVLGRKYFKTRCGVDLHFAAVYMRYNIVLQVPRS